MLLWTMGKSAREEGSEIDLEKPDAMICWGGVGLNSEGDAAAAADDRNEH